MRDGRGPDGPGFCSCPAQWRISRTPGKKGAGFAALIFRVKIDGKEKAVYTEYKGAGGPGGAPAVRVPSGGK